MLRYKVSEYRVAVSMLECGLEGVGFEEDYFSALYMGSTSDHPNSHLQLDGSRDRIRGDPLSG